MKNLFLLTFLMAALLGGCAPNTRVVSGIGDYSVPSNATASNSNVIVEQRIPAEKLSEVDLKLGTAEAIMGGTLCFRTANSELTENTLVTVVNASSNELPNFVESHVFKKLEDRCTFGSVENDLDPNKKLTSFYLLKTKNQDDTDRMSGIGIGIIIGPDHSFKIKDGFVRTDVNGDGKQESLRRCGRAKDLYLAVWSGKPSTGKRIWESHYRVLHDEHTVCTKDDLRMGDG